MQHMPPPPPAYHWIVPFSLASIIKVPPNPEKEIPYQDLVCTDQDRAYIIEIITGMAENSKFSLLLKQNHFKNIGTQINHVHPLKFLVVAVSSPQLKANLEIIFDDYFKRNGFMDGLGPCLTREAEKGKLEKYLPAFAAEVGIPEEKIRPYFQARDWDGFVRFLMHS